MRVISIMVLLSTLLVSCNEEQEEEKPFVNPVLGKWKLLEARLDLSPVPIFNGLRVDFVSRDDSVAGYFAYDRPAFPIYRCIWEEEANWVMTSEFEEVNFDDAIVYRKAEMLLYGSHDIEVTVRFDLKPVEDQIMKMTFSPVFCEPDSTGRFDSSYPIWQFDFVRIED